MGISINTNLSSLIVQQNLTKSTLGLNKAIERMTTGYKINGAKDNAAGCSISEKMSRQLSSFDVASDNVAAGMDLVTTASDTIDLMINSAQRLHALSTQARNGTYGNDSINAMNQEASAIVANIQRLYNRTEYNDINLFDNISSIIKQRGLPKAGKSGFIDESGISEAYKSGASKLFGEIEYVIPDEIITDPTQLADAIANNSKIGIANAETLAKLAELVNSGTSCSGKTIVLTEDIDLSGYSNWTAIGTELKYFSGSFDGQGHTISNLKIDKPTEKNQGLFGCTDAGCSIKNVCLKNVDVKSDYNVGGLVGYAFSSTISNSYITGNVTGQDQFVGGMVGYANNTIITNSNATVDVKGYSSRVGGLVGACGGHSTITNCYATGSVTGQLEKVGGLVGFCAWYTTVTNSYATGNVKGQYRIGGLAGESGEDSTISNCYATGNVTGEIERVGGLVGNSYSAISNSYATGIVTGQDRVGGLTGRSAGSISNCISFNKVYGQTNVGQFVGYVSDCTISANCSAIDSGLKKLGNVADEDTVTSFAPLSVKTTLQVGINGESNSQITFNTNFSYDLSAVLNGIETDSAFDAINTFLKTLNEKSTDLGAISNRLDSALESIETNIQNLTSSRSTIKDADVATESSNYIRMQILQQASATLLSTANQTPALALTLLNGIR